MTSTKTSKYWKLPLRFVYLSSTNNTALESNGIASERISNLVEKQHFFAYMLHCKYFPFFWKKPHAPMYWLPPIQPKFEAISPFSSSVGNPASITPSADRNNNSLFSFIRTLFLPTPFNILSKKVDGKPLKIVLRWCSYAFWKKPSRTF